MKTNWQGIVKVLGQALERIKAGFSKTPERLNAVYMRRPVDKLILAVADAKVAVKAPGC